MKKLLLALFFVTMSSSLFSQNDLLDILNDETPKNTTEDIVTSTFKGTRIVNGHSIENKNDKELEFIIAHRFGRINTGFYDLFGLDNANIRFALEYGLTDNLTIGAGRSSYEKTYDSFLKYSLIKQKKGENSFPVAISLFGSAAVKTLRDYDPADKRSFAESLFYVGQVLIAKKISPSLSLQLAPTYVHRNTVRTVEDPHDIFALGFGGRIKLSKRVALNTEYYYTFDESKSINTRNSLAFGVDIETGGHVFQIILSNAITMIEKSFISETTGNFFGGDIHLGFNLSRTF
jgi:opacity protein-like surface antigen|tara:strand:- start:9180 stop:10049 length:870 start_codon:yes stop_codon:yes gene_type:complete